MYFLLSLDNNTQIQREPIFIFSEQTSADFPEYFHVNLKHHNKQIVQKFTPIKDDFVKEPDIYVIDKVSNNPILYKSNLKVGLYQFFLIISLKKTHLRMIIKFTSIQIRILLALFTETHGQISIKWYKLYYCSLI